MFKFVKRAFNKKKARRITQEYSYKIDNFLLPEEGEIQFANWLNPLVKSKTLTQSEVNFYRKFIKKGDLAIDIGANIGDTTVPMALAAGKEGLTLGFDPNPYVFKILEANARLNPDKVNIVPLPYAITEKESEFFYNSSEASFANGGIQEIDKGYHGKYALQQKIKGIRLSDFLRTHYPEEMKKLSFIKVDAEGLDSVILKSVKDLIEAFKPLVIAECFTRSSKEERYDLFNTVALPGYKVYKFDDFDENAPTTLISGKEEMTNWKTFNLYAIYGG
ncbi:FkbM family methyltransferase [Agriterribacter sp.]|uniref:FkbM family methyltransferase n=1 Tax=Agriterribacter sp. TaxID=2821509 RepID=UPI002C3EDF87|nr:FkbM family methyltransferase [Agriterribacter sp.]HRP56466.1 FkbM family methyltransferase [Agriterribacter sp.]